MFWARTEDNGELFILPTVVGLVGGFRAEENKL